MIFLSPFSQGPASFGKQGFVISAGNQAGETGYGMKVRILMETRQTVDGETELIRHEARAVMRLGEEDAVLTYLLDGIHHEMLINFRTPSVSVTRNWQEGQSLFYESGRKHTVRYETPAGSIDLSFETKSILLERGNFTGGDARLSLSYRISQYGEAICDCELSIAISPLE